jgi:hypothetical protein
VYWTYKVDSPENLVSTGPQLQDSRPQNLSANSSSKIYPSKCLRVALVGCSRQGIENQAYLSSARADPVHTVWEFCPSTPAAILFTVLFALTTFAHLLQAVFYKKTYCWVVIGSGLLQTLNYIFRIVSIKSPNSLGPYTAWFVLILASHFHAT